MKSRKGPEEVAAGSHHLQLMAAHPWANVAELERIYWSAYRQVRGLHPGSA